MKTLKGLIFWFSPILIIGGSLLLESFLLQATADFSGKIVVDGKTYYVRVSGNYVTYEIPFGFSQTIISINENGILEEKVGIIKRGGAIYIKSPSPNSLSKKIWTLFKSQTYICDFFIPSRILIYC